MISTAIILWFALWIGAVVLGSSACLVLIVWVLVTACASIVRPGEQMARISDLARQAIDARCQDYRQAAYVYLREHQKNQVMEELNEQKK